VSSIDRRTMIKGGAAALSLAMLPGALRAEPLRRVRPGEPGWPSDASWAELDRTVGGNLIKSQPLLAPCGLDERGAACTDLLKHLNNPMFIGDQPSGTQVSGWFKAWSPASSAYVVRARGAADIAAAVDFARRHRLRLAVKGGGHSYQGTSTAADSLLIWTRSMNAVEVHAGFVPAGCATTPVPAVSLGAGAMWIDAYDAVTTKSARYVQGGGCTSVGVAGLVQSGGFGSNSKMFGTAAASLLEAEVITADGAVRIANDCQDPDLYWALKGGGGGSFGVIARLTLRTHELPEFMGAAGATIKARSDAAFRQLVDRFLEHYSSDLLNPHWGEQASVKSSNELKIQMVSAGLTPQATEAALKPFFEWSRTRPKDYEFSEEPWSGAGAAQHWWDIEARRKRGSTAMIADDRPGAPSSHAWWSGDQEQCGAYLYGYESMWLPQSLLRGGRRRDLVDALFAASRHNDVDLHFNKGLAGAPPGAIAATRDTATNPKVLDSFALAIIATGGASRYPGLPQAPRDGAEAEAGARAIDKAAAALRRVAPGSGSYVSESNFFNDSWARDFWGTNYPRLRAVKRKYDPDGLFTVHHGVGSEDWSDDGRRELADDELEVGIAERGQQGYREDPGDGRALLHREHQPRFPVEVRAEGQHDRQATGANGNGKGIRVKQPGLERGR
jgi:FAD/FMN-containing dehydrogenase